MLHQSRNPRYPKARTPPSPPRGRPPQQQRMGSPALAASPAPSPETIYRVQAVSTSRSPRALSPMARMSTNPATTAPPVRVSPVRAPGASSTAPALGSSRTTSPAVAIVRTVQAQELQWVADHPKAQNDEPISRPPMLRPLTKGGDAMNGRQYTSVPALVVALGSRVLFKMCTQEEAARWFQIYRENRFWSIIKTDAAGRQYRMLAPWKFAYEAKQAYADNFVELLMPLYIPVAVADNLIGYTGWFLDNYFTGNGRGIVRLRPPTAHETTLAGRT